MGIVNVTPDSFSDGGRLASVEAAVAHGLALVEQGVGEVSECTLALGFGAWQRPRDRVAVAAVVVAHEQSGGVGAVELAGLGVVVGAAAGEVQHAVLHFQSDHFGHLGLLSRPGTAGPDL
jgi:hypothetical protein